MKQTNKQNVHVCRLCAYNNTEVTATEDVHISVADEKSGNVFVNDNSSPHVFCPFHHCHGLTQFIINLRHSVSEKGPTVLGKRQERSHKAALPVHHSGYVLADVLLRKLTMKRIFGLMRPTEKGSLFTYVDFFFFFSFAVYTVSAASEVNWAVFSCS